jgi:hypothetical protein
MTGYRICKRIDQSIIVVQKDNIEAEQCMIQIVEVAPKNITRILWERLQR